MMFKWLRATDKNTDGFDIRQVQCKMVTHQVPPSGLICPLSASISASFKSEKSDALLLLNHFGPSVVIDRKSMAVLSKELLHGQWLPEDEQLLQNLGPCCDYVRMENGDIVSLRGYSPYSKVCVHRCLLKVDSIEQTHILPFAVNRLWCTSNHAAKCIVVMDLLESHGTLIFEIVNKDGERHLVKQVEGATYRIEEEATTLDFVEVNDNCVVHIYRSPDGQIKATFIVDFFGTPRVV